MTNIAPRTQQEPGSPGFLRLGGGLSEAIARAPSAKARSTLKAQAHRQALVARRPQSGPLTLNRGGLTVIVDSHSLVLDKEGNAIGFEVMVRAFRGGNEVKIDPHRRFINPPTQVPDGTTRTETDALGNQVERDNFKEDVDDAFVRILFESIEGNPNPSGWRAK